MKTNKQFPSFKLRNYKIHSFLAKIHSFLAEMIKLGQMVLKGVSLVHNDKNGSIGLESSEQCTQQ